MGDFDCCKPHRDSAACRKDAVNGDIRALSKELFIDHVSNRWGDTAPLIGVMCDSVARVVLASRWLAEHDRQVAEMAWERGRDDERAAALDRTFPVNPYRRASNVVRLEGE